MPSESTNTSLRLLAVFLMGISVGICLTLVYLTWREPPPIVMQNPMPSHEESEP